MQGLRIAIMTDETGWHTTRLRKALVARGAQARCIDLADCRIDTTASRHGLVIPGFGRELPDAVIVRGIAGGSFEQITVRLGVLHALQAAGVAVYNEARAIERSVDKSMTSLLLHQAGIPTPPSWAMESLEQAKRVLSRELAAGHKLVLKPLFGSQGKGLQLLSAPIEPALRQLVAAFEQHGRLVYLQRFVEPLPRATAAPGDKGFDLRVLVVGGHALTAMRRVSQHWIHNVAQGARCAPADLDAPMTALAVRATQALGLDYAGIDLMPTDDCGGYTVIEVNGVAAWRGLQSVTQCDIAQCLVDDLLARKRQTARSGQHQPRAA
jgi:RimK family alpha-L-glutamate ligase